jgi:uncharacterized protein (TIGR04255 family)
MQVGVRVRGGPESSRPRFALLEPPGIARRSPVTLDLPAPSTAKLERSPLSLVVCQVRHEQNLAASDPKRAVAVHDQLNAAYPVLEEQSGQEITIAAGATGIQALPGQQSRGWKMRSTDQGWTAVVMPEFFSLETTRYDDWPDFRSRLETFARAVHEAIDPSLEQRVGIRFIDQITHPDVNTPQDWRGWIDDAFLGPIAHDSVGSSVTTTQQLLQLDAGDGRSIILRHGCIREQEKDAWMYLLDHDCFVQRGRPFDVDELVAAVEDLHTLALQVFQAAITPDLYSYLRGETE